MPIPIFPPKKDSELFTWTNNFDTKITASPTTYGLDATQATAYNVLHAAFVAAYSAATNPSTNSKANIITKNVAKDKLISAPGGARELVNIVQAFPDTTDDMRGHLGLRIADTTPTPVPAPETPPNLSIISTFGRTIKVQLRDQDSSKKWGKPAGVQGATILYYVGDVVPTDVAEWTFALNTSKTNIEVELPASIISGSKVWLVAFWFNPRKESSPASSFEYTRIGDGLPLAA